MGSDRDSVFVGLVVSTDSTGRQAEVVVESESHSPQNRHLIALTRMVSLQNGHCLKSASFMARLVFSSPALVALLRQCAEQRHADDCGANHRSQIHPPSVP